MKSRILLIAFIICIVLFALSCDQKPDSKELRKPAKALGRYQLFNGTYRFFDHKNNRVQELMGVFLLDTQTGETRIFHDGLNAEGKNVLEWIRVPDQEDPLGILPDSTRQKNLKKKYGLE